MKRKKCLKISENVNFRALKYPKSQILHIFAKIETLWMYQGTLLIIRVIRKDFIGFWRNLCIFYVYIGGFKITTKKRHTISVRRMLLDNCHNECLNAAFLCWKWSNLSSPTYYLRENRQISGPNCSYLMQMGWIYKSKF